MKIRIGSGLRSWRNAMTRIITYSLRLDTLNSDGYYRAIAAFADEWLVRAMGRVGEDVARFRGYRRLHGAADRSEAECAFELLALGVLVREHADEARRWPAPAAYMLSGLVAAQNRWPRAEGLIKAIRGWTGWLVRAWPAPGAGDTLTGLMAWLRANGDGARADRFAQWIEYFAATGLKATRDILLRCLALAEDFAEVALAALGRYTVNVDQFVSNTAPLYRRRYDAALVARSRLEYHLGMLGTEMLNRAYRERFLATHSKVVIVPPCMRAQPDSKCEAVETPMGAQCQACTPTCRVHQITKLGEKRGFQVYMIPDELRVFGSSQGAGSLGVVGVSCALTNWAGGWEADALGLPAQGVLLDYVGCQFHWDEVGLTTDVNLKKLAEVATGVRVAH
jgi:hypothetical protein